MTTSDRQPLLEKLAATLREAQASGTPCAALTGEVKDLSTADAYTIQQLNIAYLLADKTTPARIVGHKVGLTSEAVQSWLKVDQPDFGQLLSTMSVRDAGTVKIEGRLLQPRVEGEVAFVLKDRLCGPGVTAADVIRATDFVVPSIEIIDSRIADWKITFHDTVADNASSSLFVLGGTPRKLTDIDLELAGCVLRKNGQVASTGAGAACLDHPVNAVAWLANTLGELDVALEPGHVVLSGALGPVVPVAAGDDVEVEIAHLGRVSVRFE